jgi:hypothetical protein
LGTHAAGDDYAVMASGEAIPAPGHPNGIVIEKLLTTSDVLFALANPHPRWSQYRAPSYCHNELAPDFDLMIPELNGARALLNYDGIIGGYRTWSVVYTNKAPNPQGCANNTRDANGNITLTDVRSMDGNFASAVLQPWGGKYRLLAATR